MVYGSSSSKAFATPMTMAVVLLVSLLGAIGIIYIWSSTIQRSGHAIQIQSVAFQQNQTYVYVQNIGKGKVILDVIYLGDHKFTVRQDNCTIGEKRTNIIEEGQTAKISINKSYTDEIYIRVICTDGTFHEAYWRPQK